MQEPSCLQLLDATFPGIRANCGRLEKLGFPWPSRPFMREDGGEVVSHVGCLEYPMVIDGKWHSVGALHAICTEEAHRRRGLASGLIREALKWAEERYEFVILFTEIPKFYEKRSFQTVQEYRFHMPCRHPKGSQSLHAMAFPNDNAAFLRCFKGRAPLSNHVWVRDNGFMTAWNALFGAYPTYWSLHYSPSIGILSYEIKGKTLHLYDIIAAEIPPLEVILDHLPRPIEEIYFYFSPDLLLDAAHPEPYLYDNGHFMVHGKWPKLKPFMIPPLCRC